ncbi:hypothetical protein [Halorussus pelagicus]|nr:hypothetical protein [Halorussus pelagicus]
MRDRAAAFERVLFAGQSGVSSALRDLGYWSIGAAGGGEFPHEFHIKEEP